MYRINRLPVFVLILFFSSQVSAQIQFSDVTTSAGSFRQGESWGASWGDINGDGWPDAFASFHRDPPSIWINNKNGTFTDKTSELDASGTWVASPNADIHGGSITDFDGDGDKDLYVTAGSTAKNQFLVNENGVLVNKTAQFDPNVAKWRARLPIWFDFTNDGLLDFIMASENSVGIYEQTGSGFIDITASATVSCDGSQAAYLADMVGDDRLELLCGSSKFPFKAYESSSLPFVLSTSEIPQTGWALETAMADFNGDLKQDFFTVRGQKRLSEALKTGNNRLEIHMITTGTGQRVVEFISDGLITIDAAKSNKPGGFLDKIFVGLAGTNPSSTIFSASFSDPNAAGIKVHDPSVDTGIFIGYIAARGVWRIEFSPGGGWNQNYLKITSDTTVSQVTLTGLNAGDKPLKPALIVSTATGYVDRTSSAGLGAPVKCISATAADFDNDKDIDLYLVCRGGVVNTANIFYENQGDGTFMQVANAGGAEGPIGNTVTEGKGGGESVVISDYNIDGFVDMLVTNGLNMLPEHQGGPVKLYQNQGNSNHWIELDLVGNGVGGSNRDAVGAKVYATSGGQTQFREQNGGFHRWSQNDQRIHFGLGDDTQVDIEVRWPGGTVETFSNLTVDCLYRVSEGSGIEGVTIGSSNCGGSVPLSLSIDDVSAGEGTGVAVFTVSLSSPSLDKVVTVDYLTKDDTATAGSDYTSSTGTLSFNVGDTTKSVTVPILQDSSTEGNETFTLILSNAANAAIGDGAGVGTIIDDDVNACGEPVYDKSTEKGVFLWKTCDGGDSDWFMRVTGGGDTSKSTYIGSVNLDQPFLLVSNISIEPKNDTVDNVTDTTLLDFQLNVWNSSFDGIDFTFPAGSSACFDTTQLPAGAQVYIGSARTPMTGSFDLETLSQCGATGLPPECGKPAYDRKTEKGVFLWKLCDGGDSDWFMRVIGGGDPSKSAYQGALNLNQNFVSVTAVNKEANDVLDYVTDPTRIDFLFNVWNTAFDGVDFSYPAGSSACFDTTSLPVGAQVYIGMNRLSVTPPIDLESLGACQ